MPTIGNKLPDLPNSIDSTVSMLISTLTEFSEEEKGNLRFKDKIFVSISLLFF